MKSKRSVFHLNRTLLCSFAAIIGGLLISCHEKETRAIAAVVPDTFTDRLILGDAKSEAAHGFISDSSETIKGGLDQLARRILPPAKPGWKGGKMDFVVKIDPDKQNYFTVRLWGGDVNHNQLTLLCNGKQIGYRHLGDIEALDIGADQPCYPGRFTYRTCPLPLAMTTGKQQLDLTIQSSGPIWGYANNFDQYQKPMTEATRGIYDVFTHTDGCLQPPATEIQGKYPEAAPVRNEPGVEVLEELEKRVNGEIDGLLKNPKQAASQMQAVFLARAYATPWTHAAGKPATLEKITTSLDSLYRAFVKDPSLAHAEPSTYNPDWFGTGPSGLIVTVLKNELAPTMDALIDDGTGKQISRREGYTNMLIACREIHRENRRQYTNQTMINDLYGIYHANRGVAALIPAKALSEKKALSYLYESVGLMPWLGKEKNGVPEYTLGKSFYQLTSKGLTKELGFVGNYGEVLDWVTQIYEATRPAAGQPGDEKIKQQLVRIARARAPFRYPMLDAGGNRAVVQETVVGWRDTHYPGDVTYAQRPSWDGTPLEVACATGDPQIVGYCQQMLEDHQFFNILKKTMENKGSRTTFGMLAVPVQYEKIKELAATHHRLPMSWDQPDFVFSDEEDGVVAIKNGKEIFYASLYWRARNAVNFLGRVHYLTPEVDRVAVVSEEIQYKPSGMEYTRENWTNFGFANGGIKYMDKVDSAHTGEKLPIAKIPDGVPFKPGQESIFAGKGDFYTLRYGPYLIGMNMSADRTFEITVPADAKSVKELVSKRSGLPAGSVSKVAPHTTVVFYLSN